MFAVALLAIATSAPFHDGPDPRVAFDLQPRYLQNGVLKARLGPDARISGQPTEAKTPLGQCLKLDGKKDGFVIADNFRDHAALMPKQKFTVEAWASVSMGQSYGSFMSVLQDNGNFEKGWVLGHNDKSFTFALSTTGADDGDGKMTYLKGKTEFTIGKLYHIVGTFDGEKMRLYVNGALDAESTEQSGEVLYPEKAPWTLGVYKDDDEDFPLAGRMVQVAMYDLVATEEGVKHLFSHKKELADAAPEVPQAAEFDWVVKPYQQLPLQTGISILWETSRPGTSVVHVGQNKNSLKPVSGGIETNPQTLIHKVHLTGLKPDSHYVYKVESTDAAGKKLESGLLTFKTAPEADRAIRFTILGDTQDQPKVNNRIAEHMWNERPDFFMIVGDLVGTGANKMHWTDHFFGSMRPLFDRVPLIPVLGNHEGDARLYYDYMHVPAPEYWYQFKYGPAEFFVVDSNRDVKEGSEQYKWLEAALAKSKSKWKFVAHHHPPYSSDEDDFGNLWEGQSTRGDQRLQDMVKLYEKYKVDVVWTGHIHSYERTWPILKNRASEKGPVYIVCGGGGGGLETHGPTRPEFSNRIRHGHHYCVVSINGNSFEMSAFDIEGRQFDGLKIKK